MTKEEYTAATSTLSQCAVLLALHDWSAYIDKGTLADDLGVFMDPTLWQRAHDNLSDMTDMARSAKAICKLRFSIVEREQAASPEQVAETP